MASSLLSPADLAAIGDLRLDGLETVLQLSPFAVTFYRYDEGAGQAVALPPQRAALRWGGTQPDVRQAPAAGTARVRGTLRGFAPDFDVAIGDGFDAGGVPCRVVAPLLTKDGVTRCDFVADEGT